MIPPYYGPDTSKAERKLFEMLRNEHTIQGWTCFHSLGIARHLYKNQGEIDFLLLGPRGIFVLEVKGGRVSREDGIWKFTDKHGRVTDKKESPFKQASSATYSLLDELARKIGPRARTYISGFGVVFPDIKFDATSPEWDNAVIFDSRDMEKPVSAYLSRLFSYWESRHRDRAGIPGGDLSVIHDHLRGNFECVRPLSLDIEESESEIIRLTDEQYQAFDHLSDSPRLIFYGPAGTGKTMLAFEKARRNAAEGRKTLFLCFNRLLGSFLASIAAREGMSDYVTIMSIHKFFQGFIREAGLMNELEHASREEDPTKVFSQMYPEYFLKAWGGRDPVFDEIILDEGQDFITPEYIMALDQVFRGGFQAGRWTIFLDPESQKDMFAAFDEQIFRELKGYAVPYALTVNCRNTKPIAIQAEAVSGYKVGQIKRIQGLQVQLLRYKDVSDQAAQVSKFINRLLADGVAPEEITILSVKRYDASLAGTGRLRINKPYFKIDESNIGKSRDGRIACATVQSFKGLESGVIILTDLTDIGSEHMKTVNYVGFTRARDILAVAMHENLEKDYLGLLRRVAAESGAA